MTDDQNSSQGVGRAKSAAGEAAQHPWVKNLARVGLAAIGVIYLLVGGLALQIALGSGAVPAPDKQAARGACAA